MTKLNELNCGISTCLELLYKPTSDYDCALDIVAVHGFGGHSYQSWTSSNQGDHGRSMWLRDLLPYLIPNTRIHTFSYSSTANNAADVLRPEALTSIAEALLQEVLSVREENSDIPIAFVAHDLGGVIVKKALLIDETNKTSNRTVARQCERLVFFGTPQRASAISSSWEDLLLNILFTSPTPVPSSINYATKLKCLSVFVEEISTKFALSSTRCLVNVYEEADGGKNSTPVINPYSASMGLIHEINLPRQLDHLEICTFSDLDPTLSIISKFLKAETNPSYRKCISSLYNVSPPSVIPDTKFYFYFREHDVKRQYQEFLDWMDGSSSRIIATSGGNGTEKELLASMLFQQLQKRSLCATYFSFAGSDARRASSTHFLASMVLQLLIQDPARYSRIAGIYETMLTPPMTAWTQATLLTVFQSTLDTEDSQGPLHIIIDGLHRCDSSWRTLLDALLAIFKTLRQNTKLKVAVFYQERKDIESALDAFGHFCVPGPTLAQESPVMPLSEDLTDCLTRNNPCLLPLTSHIRAALDRCKDYAHLSLALHSLRKSITTSSSHGTIRTLTETFPPPLQGEILSRFNSLRGWVRTAVAWVCHAKRPLSLAELVNAVAITGDSAEFTASFSPESIPLNPTTELTEALGGLVRTDDGIAFIEDVNKTYMLELMANGQQHDATVLGNAQISTILIEYLSWGEFFQPLKQAVNQLPFIQPTGPLFDLARYAMDFWSHHYRESAPTDQSLTNTLLSKLKDIASLSGTTPFLLAAQLGLVGILKALKERSEICKKNCEQAIILASQQGHEDAVSYLLDLCVPLAGDVCDLSEAVRQASAHGYQNIVTKILDHLKSQNTQDNLLLSTLICQAALFGYESQVELFLQYGADINAVVNQQTPLQLAINNGHASVVQYLLKEGKADMDLTAGAETDTPLLLAVFKGYEVIVQYLVDYGADTNVRTRQLQSGPEGATSLPEGSTPLHIAARHGNLKIVEHLLKKRGPSSSNGPDINTKDGQGRSPLMVACVEGHEDIAMRLLDCGATPGIDTDNDSHSTLYYAIRPGNSELLVIKLGLTGIVKRCLSSKSPIRAEGIRLTRYIDFQKRTALHHAAECGFRGIVALILDMKDGVLVDARDDSENTPLALAALAGKDSIVELLLSHGANPLLHMKYGPTEGHVAVVKRLLDKGVDPNATDILGQGSLHSAAWTGKVDIVHTLLTHGTIPINVKLRGRRDWNALHFAAGSGRIGAWKVSQMLIYAGTDPLLADVYGWMPVHLAARADANRFDADLLQLLWEQDRNSIETKTRSGLTPLHFASECPIFLEWMLKRGAKVDAVDDKGDTALMMSASNDNRDAIRVLLSSGANPLLVNSRGQNALHTAAHAGGVKAGEALIKFCGKDAERLVRQMDQSNRSALHVAISNSKPAFAEMVLKTFYEKATGAALEDLSAVRKSDGETPLISAVRRGQKGVIKKLLALGAETETRDSGGNTALLAAIKAHEKNALDIVRLLLDQSTGKNCAKVNGGGGAYPTALHQAALWGKMELVKELVNKLGANVNGVGGKYNTALTAAASEGHIEIVKFLLKSGAKQNIPGCDAPFVFTPVQAAVNFGAIELITLLLKAGDESVNFEDSQGRTAIHIAARIGSKEIVHLLMKESYPVLEHLDKQGRSLLHHVVLSLNAEFANIILQWNQFLDFSLNIPDVDGWTPLHWACRTDDNEDVVAVLIKVGGDEAVMKKTNDGWTPESICAFHDSGTTKTFIDACVKRIRDNERNEKNETKEPPKDAELTVTNEASEDKKPSKATERPVPVDRESSVKAGSKPKHWKRGYCHMSLVCDGCLLDPVVGVFWRCEVCEDFGFCFKCFWTAEKTHPAHKFTKIPMGAGDTVREPQLAGDFGSKVNGYSSKKVQSEAETVSDDD